MTAILKVDTIQDTAGNNIINESSDTITIGASGDTTNIVGTLQNNGSALAGGITVADQWRLTADFTGAADPISSNLERVDTTGQGTIGSAMTVSSGLFTFPSTGIYLVSFTAALQFNGDTRYYVAYIESTRDNGSNFTELTKNETFIQQTGSAATPNTVVTSTLMDITDTGNDKVRFEVLPLDNSTITKGDSTKNETFMTFIRLGDT
tara:strand:+ start:436 stop:1056 length:621 start_codon:yes stop_codon:yes gene_type:complete